MRHFSGLIIFLVAAGLGCLTAQASADGGSVLRDSQGNPVRTSAGSCISFPGAKITDPACLPDIKSNTGETLVTPLVATFQSEPKTPPTASTLEWQTLHFVTQTPFPLNGAGLAPAMRTQLLEFLVSLEPYFKVVTLKIVGHSDASGTAHYNNWLSQQRAASVGIYFRSLGVDPRLMSISGAGESELLSNITATAAKQRRIEIAARVQLNRRTQKTR